MQVNQQQIFTLTVSGGQSPYTYQWYGGTSPNCNSDPEIPGATGITYAASQSSAGVYYYCAVVSDSNHQTADAGPVQLNVISAPPLLSSKYGCYAEVNISNQQNVGTGPYFQQMVVIPSYKYSSCANKNLSNMLFTADAPENQTGNVPLYSWIESGASNTSTNTLIWINMNSISLGAEGSFKNTTTLYMNFLPNNSPVTSKYTGYAPQLWCASGCYQTSYAQYDNGGKVFDFYDNFAGNALNTSKWSVSNDGGLLPSCISYAVNNGFTITGYDINNCGFGAFGAIQSVFPISSSQVADVYGTSFGSSNIYGDMYTGYTVMGDNPAGVYLLSDHGRGECGGPTSLCGCIKTTENQNSCTGSLPSLSGSDLGVWSISINSISPSYISANFQLNYSNTQSAYLSSSSGFQTLGLDLFGYYDDISYTNGIPYYIQWIRLRQQPPNGVMPTVNISKLTPLSVSLSTSQTYLFSSGSAVLTANALGGIAPYTYSWYEEAPGQSVYTLITGASSNTYNFNAFGMPAGTYSFIASVHGNTEYPITQANSSPVKITVNDVGYAYVFNSESCPVSTCYPANVVSVSTSTSSVTSNVTSFTQKTQQGLLETHNGGAVAFAPSGAYAYATNPDLNEVEIITPSGINGNITSGFSDPKGVAISPDGSFAYVTNYNSNNVVIINTATSSVVGAITAGFSKPFGVAIAPNGKYAYIVNYYTQNVVVVSTSTNSVVGAIDAGEYYGLNYPTGVTFSPNGGYAYILNTQSDGNNALIINTANGQPVNVITSGFNNATGIAIMPNSAMLYVTNYGNEGGAEPGFGANVVIINAVNNQVVGAISSGIAGPGGVAFSPIGTYPAPSGAYPAPLTPPPLAVTAISQQSSVYAGETMRISATVSNGVPPYTSQWYEEAPGQSVYTPVPGTQESGYTTFRPFSETAPSTPGTYSFFISVSDANTPTHQSQTVNSLPVSIIDTGTLTNYAYVTNMYGQDISIINTASNTVQGSISNYQFGYTLNDPDGVAFSPDGTNAYITNSGSSNVIIFSTSTNSVVGAINSGFSHPSSIAISSGGYAYVANRGSSNVVIINTNKNTIVGSIKSGIYDPFSVAVEPNGNAYVVNYYSYNVIIINTATGVPAGIVNLGYRPSPVSVALSPSGNYAYISLSTTGGTDEIATVNTITNDVTNTIITSGTGNIAVSPDGSFAYLISGSEIEIINLATDSIVSTISSSTFDLPADVAFHPVPTG